MIDRYIRFWMGIAILGLCAGCATKPQQSVLLDDCKELVVPQKVWEGRDGSYVARLLLTDIELDTIQWKRKVIGVVDAGTQVRIAQILRGADGSWGPFLRVQVEILDGSFRGQIAEVPSHVPYHPEPRWTMEFTLDPNGMEFNPEIVKPCDA